MKQLIKQDDFGKVYLVKKYNKKYIVKVTPILNTQSKSQQKRYLTLVNPHEAMPWREVELSLFINTLTKPDSIFFTQMIQYKIIQCKATFTNFSPTNFSFKKQPTNKCLQIAYNHRGQPLTTLLTQQNQPLKEIYNMIIQTLYGLNVLKQAGYLHKDIHSGNITFRRNQYTTPIVLRININTLTISPKYIYSLVDYGNNKHSKYETNVQQEKSNVIVSLQLNTDVVSFIMNIILQTNVLQELYKQNNITRSIEPKFKMENIVDISKTYKTTWNRIKATLTKKGPHYENWLNTFDAGRIDTFYENFQDQYPILKTHGPHKLNRTIPQEIDILFSTYNRTGWLKMNHWHLPFAKNVPNLIPQKDIEYIILNLTNNSKIIDRIIQIMNC